MTFYLASIKYFLGASPLMLSYMGRLDPDHNPAMFSGHFSKLALVSPPPEP